MATSGDIIEPGTGPAEIPPAAIHRPRFTWRYDHKVDAQGRVPMPAKWRPDVPSSLSLMAVMIRHTSGDEFVMVLPAEQFDRFIDPLCRGDFTEPLRMAERHDYVDRIIELELDSAGRLLVSSVLREFAGLDKQVMLVGQGSHFEVWSMDNWRQQLERVMAGDEMSLPAELEGFSL